MLDPDHPARRPQSSFDRCMYNSGRDANQANMRFDRCWVRKEARDKIELFMSVERSSAVHLLFKLCVEDHNLSGAIQKSGVKRR
jgi:hypothetical protein